MFLNNKYTKWYFGIIDKAKGRKAQIKIEKHHIIPKSLGGGNNKNNLAELTPREHFVCHFLLIKMLVGKNKAKMVNAALRLSNDHKGRCVNSKIYEAIKSARVDYLKTLCGPNSPNFGRKVSEETRKKQSESRKRWSYTPAHIEKFKGRVGPMLGKTHSAETKKRLSEFGKSRVPSEKTKHKTSKTMLALHITRSPETRKKMSQTKLGIVHPRKICKYCNKDSTVAMYARWHGEKCKSRIHFSTDC